MRDTVPPREMRYRGEARRGAGTAPDALRKAGRARIDAGLKKHGARRHAARTNRIIQALTKQTAMVAGTAAADTVPPHPPHPARRLIAPRSQAGRRRVTRDGGFWVASSRAPSGTTSPPGSRPWCGPTLFTGRTHNQALLALAHRRVTLHAMIRDAALTTRSQQHNAA